MEEFIMLKKLCSISFLLMAIFIGSVSFDCNNAEAAIRCGRDVVYENTIVRNDGGIEVEVGNEYVDSLYRFVNQNNQWYFASSSSGRNFKNWQLVSNNQHANDILYIVLQYI